VPRKALAARARAAPASRVSPCARADHEETCATQPSGQRRFLTFYPAPHFLMLTAEGDVFTGFCNRPSLANSYEWAFVAEWAGERDELAPCWVSPAALDARPARP